MDNITVNKIIPTIKPVQLNITGARLLSITEATSFLSQREREYSNFWWITCGCKHFGTQTCIVYSDGQVASPKLFINCKYVSVRPVLEIQLTPNFKVGDEFYIRNFK